MPTRLFPYPVHHHSGRPLATLLAIALATVLVGAPSRAQTTLETLDLTGPVAALEEYRWYPGTNERALFQTWTFDEAGVATERVVHFYDFRDGSLRERLVTLYDAGQPLATVAYDPDDEPTAQTVFRYDGEGRLVEEVAVDAEGVETRKTVIERDAAGNAVRATYTRGGALERVLEGDYDADGGVLEQRRFDAEGRLAEVSTYRVPGRERDYVRYDEEGEVAATGRVIENEHGTVLIEELGPDGSVRESYAWTYDERGRVLERRSVYDEGQREETLTYAYEDDDQGNWVRETTSEDLGGGSEVYEIRERVIRYR